MPHRQRCGGCTDQSQRLLLTPCPCLPASCLPSRYVVRAPTDSDQITLLANTLADKKLDELPLYAALLRKFSQKEVRRSGRGGRGERRPQLPLGADRRLLGRPADLAAWLAGRLLCRSSMRPFAAVVHAHLRTHSQISSKPASLPLCTTHRGVHSINSPCLLPAVLVCLLCRLLCLLCCRCCGGST